MIKKGVINIDFAPILNRTIPKAATPCLASLIFLVSLAQGTAFLGRQFELVCQRG